MDDTGDGSTLATILQSDHLIHAIQRELKVVYPDKEIPTNTIRRILYSALLRQNLHVTKSTRLFHRKTAQSPIEHEETLDDLLRYDKVYSVYGG